MRISFEITADDVVAANHLHYAHSPATRWLRWTMLGTGPLIGLLIVIFSIAKEVHNGVADVTGIWIALALGSLMGGSLFFLLPWYISKAMARSVRKKLLAESLEGTVVGTVQMELAGNRLMTKTRLGESAFDLRAIKDIVEYDDYALIYLTSTQLHIIPTKNVLPEEDYRGFVAALRHAWENRDSVEAIRR